MTRLSPLGRGRRQGSCARSLSASLPHPWLFSGPAALLSSARRALASRRAASRRARGRGTAAVPLGGRGLRLTSQHLLKRVAQRHAKILFHGLFKAGFHGLAELLQAIFAERALRFRQELL